MAPKRRYGVTHLEGKCPQCGFAHTPADLMRINGDTLQCVRIAASRSQATKGKSEAQSSSLVMRNSVSLASGAVH
jgi:hypothetical protein